MVAGTCIQINTAECITEESALQSRVCMDINLPGSE